MLGAKETIMIDSALIETAIQSFVSSFAPIRPALLARLQEVDFLALIQLPQFHELANIRADKMAENKNPSQLERLQLERLEALVGISYHDITEGTDFPILQKSLEQSEAFRLEMQELQREQEANRKLLEGDISLAKRSELKERQTDIPEIIGNIQQSADRHHASLVQIADRLIDLIPGHSRMPG